MSFYMSWQMFLTYLAACFALAILPGPIVTLVIANGLRHGARPALINVAGAQAGLGVVIGIVAVGLTSLMATMGYWFDWVRLLGAAYLVWLGIRLMRAPAAADLAGGAVSAPRGGYFLQGFLVLLSNPKVLVFFGAFIPQFVDMSGDHFTQVIVLGLVFMAIAGTTDAIYGLVAARARRMMSARRTQLMSRISGACLVGGGLWLALTRAR